jgi:phosphoglycolate phosphatase
MIGISPNTRAVLFDLDGTLADSAPDMAAALNRLLKQNNMPALPVAAVRPHVSQGARGMLWAGFSMTPENQRFAALREAFLDEYRRDLFNETTLFAGIDKLIDNLESRQIAWGIVTNKLTALALPILRALGIAERAGCIVCGDTCARAKPFPDPLFHAAKLISVPESHCVYVGDDERDIQAAHAAGMKGVVAAYGYLGTGRHYSEWGAHACIDHPLELLDLIDRPTRP